VTAAEWEPSEQDRRIISIIVADEKPVLGTNDIADRLEMSQQGATYHLNRLKDQGALRTEKIGQVRIWWPTQKGLSYLDSA